MPKVLVVDDEVEVADFLCNFLRRFKIETEQATSSKEALKLYDKQEPDWVFLDIRMPDMDGFELLTALKEKDPEAKVIMITGSEDKQSQERAKSLGALDYIVKPLDLEELHKKIQNYILKK